MDERTCDNAGATAFLSETVRWRGHLVERGTAMKLAAEFDQDWAAVLAWCQAPAAEDDFDPADVLGLQQAYEAETQEQDTVVPFTIHDVPTLTRTG